MSTTFPLFLCICTILLSINAQITPIINTTGEYFIATTANSAEDSTITCNPTLSQNCYILCKDAGVCSNAKIHCQSTLCNIQCSGTSCENITIDTSNSLQASIHCADENACKSMQFTMKANGHSNPHIQTGDSVDITCNGLNACSMSTLTTKGVTMNIDCVSAKSCENQRVYTDQNSLLHLSCYKNSTTPSSNNCAGSTLLISGNNHYTTLLCNGGLNTGSCNNMQILIPQIYQYGLLDIQYKNNNGTNINPQDGSADNLKINCIDSNGSIADCTQDKFYNTSYPILGVATATSANTYSDSTAYSYRYAAIICNENHKFPCKIDCIGSQSCNYMFINSSLSDTTLICNDTNECNNVMIEATGDSIDIKCNAHQSCKTMSILQTSSANININSTTNSSYDFNVSTSQDISLECNGDHSCNNYQLLSDGLTTLDCLDTTSCKTITVQSSNGVDLQCLASYSCDAVNITVNDGDLNAICTDEHSCSGTQFYVYNAADKNTLQCTGVSSCEGILLDTSAKNILLDCNGCADSNIVTYYGQANLNINCNMSYGCNSMNVLTDGIVTMNCTQKSACVNASISNRTIRTTNIYSNSIINCLVNGACNQLEFITSTDIMGTCNGDSGCAQSNIQSLTGKINMECNDVESCVGSGINAYSHINLVCMSSGSCSQVNVSGNGELNLNCSNNGDLNCGHMKINFGDKTSYARQANHILKCGNDNNGSTSNSTCVGLEYDSYAMNVNIQCVSSAGMGCKGADIILNNDQSKLQMACVGGDSCSGLGLDTNGAIQSISCNGDRSCKGANIISNDEKGKTIVYCGPGIEVCTGSAITTATDAQIQCFGDRSCYDIAIRANAVTMECNGDFACSQTNITGQGALVLDCSHGGEDTCSGMFISMSEDTNSTATSELNCGNKDASNRTQLFSCWNTVFKSYATAVDVNCYGSGCYGSDISLENPISKLNMNCNGNHTCHKATVNTLGSLVLNCNGDKSCVAANVTSNSNMPNSFNCLGESACTSMVFKSSSDLTATCNGATSCKSSNLTALDTTLTCTGNQACFNSNLTNSGDLTLDCSGSGNENCGGMVIKSGTHNSNPKSTNTFICNNKNASDSSGYSCANSVIETYAKTITFDCSNSGGGACLDTYIYANNIDSTLSMNCYGSSACWTTSVETNGELSVNCTGNGACQSAYIRQIHPGAETMVNCTGDKSCFALALETADNISVNCFGDLTCSELSIDSDTSINMTCAGFSSCLQAKISGNNNLMLDCSGGIPNATNITNTQTCSEMVINMALNVNRTQNTLICGSDGDIKVGYACVGTVINTYANDINFQCYNDSCHNLEMNISNPTSKLDMLCIGNSSCSLMNVKTDGEINIDCHGSSSCLSSKFNPISAQPRIIGNSNIICTSDTSCEFLKVITPTNITLNCNSNKACYSTNIRSLGNGYGANCRSNASCYHLDFALKAEYTNNGITNICENGNINMSNASSVSVYCDSQIQCGCQNLNIIASDVSFLNVTANDNTLNNSKINGSSTNIVYLDFRGKYAALNGMIDVSNAKMVNMRYESDIGYGKNETNNRSLIMAPSSGKFNLECVNYGCYFGNFKNKNGLSDINITFGGTCNCTKIGDCVEEWKLQCDGGSNSFVGNKCSDGVNCCAKTDVKTVEKAFTNYTNTAKCSAGSSSSNGLSGGAIAGIVIAILAVIAVIAFGVWYYKKKKVEEPLLVND